MAETLAVINCSQLVTLAGPRRPRVGAEMRELSIIEGGAMLVRGGRVERTGVREEIERLAGADCEVVDAGLRVVVPVRRNHSSRRSEDASNSSSLASRVRRTVESMPPPAAAIS